MSAPGGAESIARVRVAFEDNFALGLECGAAISIWKDGRERLHLEGGHVDAARRTPWQSDTLALVWSATKGPASACMLHALAAQRIPLSTPVAELWPAFAAGGKKATSLGEVLSHRAGLSALADRGPRAFDHDAVAAALASATPAWVPGEAHGYGPRTFGYLIEELLRRTAGCGCGDYWRQHFAAPLGLDFWIGLPASEHPRTAQNLPPRAAALAGEKTAFEREIARPGSLANAAFSTPGGLPSPSGMNAPEVRSACLPALGGIGSARSLGGFYSMLANGAEGFFAPEAVTAFGTRLSDGPDLVLQMETAFSTGFMLDPLADGKKIRTTFGPSVSAFGHPGAGGSLAFADPENRLSFAYVMNQMEPGVLPRERTRRLVRALYGIT